MLDPQYNLALKEKLEEILEDSNKPFSTKELSITLNEDSRRVARTMKILIAEGKAFMTNRLPNPRVYIYMNKTVYDNRRKR